MTRLLKPLAARYRLGKATQGLSTCTHFLASFHEITHPFTTELCSDPEAVEMARVSKHRVACFAVILAKCLQTKRRHRFWSRSWFLRQNLYSHVHLLSELRLNDTDSYRNYLRMDEARYIQLLEKVRPLLEKQDTKFRKAISVHEKLSATLRFLATGRSYEDLKFSCAISPQSLGRIIPETCRAIYSVLRADYIKVSVRSTYFSN